MLKNRFFEKGKKFSREYIFAEGIFANRIPKRFEFRGRSFHESTLVDRFRGIYFCDSRLEGKFCGTDFRLFGIYFYFRDLNDLVFFKQYTKLLSKHKLYFTLF